VPHMMELKSIGECSRMKTCEVYNIDFKNKKLKSIRGSREVLTWKCCFCKRLFKYDSDSSSNMKRVEHPSTKCVVCLDCVNAIGDAVGGTGE